MREQESTEFMAAFTVGALLGAGAALLLRQRRRSRTERLVRSVKKSGKKTRKGARKAGERAGKRVREGADATAEAGGRVAEAGRDALGGFGAEVAEILDDARDELADGAERQFKHVEKALRRGATRLGGS